MRSLFLQKLIKATEMGEGSRGGKVVGHTKSGKPIYYHGTKADIKEFDKPGTGKHGTGYYFTPDKNEAKHFAHTLAGDKSSGTPKTYHTELDVKKPFNTMNPEHAKKVAAHHGFEYKTPKKAGGPKEHYHHLKEQMKGRGLASEENFNDKIKDAGFDHVDYDLMGHKIVFDPKNIKIKDKEEHVNKSKFLDFLLKGGPGSGQKGHKTERMPYPGEEQHKLGPMDAQKTTFIPDGGLDVHFSDPPALKAYKNLAGFFKKEGLDFQGHVTFDPKSGQISAISPQGEKSIEYVKKVISGDKTAQKPAQEAIDYKKVGAESKPEQKPGSTVDYKKMNQINKKPEGPAIDYGQKPKK